MTSPSVPYEKNLALKALVGMLFFVFYVLGRHVSFWVTVLVLAAVIAATVGTTGAWWIIPAAVLVFTSILCNAARMYDEEPDEEERYNRQDHLDGLF